MELRVFGASAVGVGAAVWWVAVWVGLEDESAGSFEVVVVEVGVGV